MLDLVILLSMALALTTVLALLLAGFMWVPWLIGLLLAGLLIALSRVSEPVDQTVLPSEPSSPNQSHPKKAVPSHSESSATQTHVTVQEPLPGRTAEHPVLTYRGAHPAPHPAEPSIPAVQPVLTYRGAKSQLHEVIPQALLTRWQGKYRGNPLKRSGDSEQS